MDVPRTETGECGPRVATLNLAFLRCSARQGPPCLTFWCVCGACCAGRRPVAWHHPARDEGLPDRAFWSEGALVGSSLRRCYTHQESARHPRHGTPSDQRIGEDRNPSSQILPEDGGNCGVVPGYVTQSGAAMALVLWPREHMLLARARRPDEQGRSGSTRSRGGGCT